MACFIKKVFEGKGSEVHSYFIRFSRGEFSNRAILNLQKTSSIKLKGSFEWANDFVRLVADISDAKFSGLMLSKKEISGLSGRKKGEIIQYNVENVSKDIINENKNKIYYTLLDARSSGITLKMKKKLPKPRKSGEAKIDDKFCQLEADLKYWPQIKDYFMLPECKKCVISHTILINELVFPPGEKDFAKIRELAKRKGRIIRKLEIDKNPSIEEREFVA